MKHIAFLLLLAPFVLTAQVKEKKINWVTIEEAQELNKEEPRKIFMDVYTDWCGPCKMMMKNTFTNADLIDYVNANYYAVKFNAESAEAITFQDQLFENPDYDPARKGRNGVHQFARYMRVSAYPTIVYLDEELNFLVGDSGYKTPQQMELMLKFFAGDKYKAIKTQEEWDAYQASFAPSFK